MKNGNSLQVLLERGVSLGIGSGMAASIGRIDDLISRPERVRDFYVGRSSRFPDAGSVGIGTVFDLASLTKILSTTLLSMRRYEEGRLDLSLKPVAGSAFTVEDLLLHASGLPAWRPFYEVLIRKFGTDLHRVPVRERMNFFFNELDSVPVERGPREKIVYSDLGFLLLGRLLAPDLAAEVGELFRSMPGVGLHYRPVIRSAIEERFLIRKCGESVMDTEICPWRGALTGLVHDDNAFSMGGVAGHAGLFGTLSDLKAWIKGLFSEKAVSLRTLERFSRTFSDASGQRRALGFDCPPTDGSGSTARVFSPSTIGHLGFTGTSLWMDLSRGVYAVLLTNRVHPTREDARIRPFRRAFHEEIGRFL